MRRVRLALDGLRLLGERCGVGRYIEALLREWDAGVASGAVAGARGVGAFETIDVYTPRPLDDAAAYGGAASPRVVPTRLPDAWWEHVVLPRAAHAAHADLLFCPAYIVPALARCPVVVTHLGSYEALPRAFPLGSRLKRRALFAASARRADLVITVSESSRADIVRYYGVAPSTVRVIPLGVGGAFRPLGRTTAVEAAARRRFPDGRPFLLFVGKLTRRRNIPQLVEAFSELRAGGAGGAGIARDLGLLMIGPNSAGYDLPALARRYRVEDALVHVPYASHEELALAYNAAALFVYPSSYEGFGIPVLEAMACGTPVVTLRNSALVEVARGAAQLAAGASPREIGGAIAAVLDSADLRAMLRARGLERAEGYRWPRIAVETLAALAEVAQRR
jgi:glycosyltransferase involved in cell wall biosynthesis